MAGNIVDKLTTKINCARGNHVWKKAYVKDNKYDAWECIHCGEKKYSINFEKDKEKK
jgi:hypothetical protein